LDLNAMMDLHGTIEELMKPAPHPSPQRVD
jgi:hypothetical protein